jgi:hypothetical protein
MDWAMARPRPVVSFLGRTRREETGKCSYGVTESRINSLALVAKDNLADTHDSMILSIYPACFDIVLVFRRRRRRSSAGGYNDSARARLTLYG